MDADIESSLVKTRIRLLLTATIAMGESFDPHKIAQTALWLIGEALGLSTGLIIVWRNEQQIILAHQNFTEDWVKNLGNTPLAIHEMFIQPIMGSGQSAAFSDLQAMPDDPLVNMLRVGGLQSLICQQVQTPGDSRGIVIMGNTHPRQLSLDDVNVFQDIVKLINTCLHNSHLYQQSQLQIRELESVTQTANAVAANTSADGILPYILQSVINRLDAETAILMLIDHFRKSLVCEAVVGPWASILQSVRIPLGEGTIGWVAENGQPLLIPNIHQDDRFATDFSRKPAPSVRAVLSVPMHSRNQLIGVIEVRNKQQGQFSQADQRLLESLATFAGIAIEYKRIYEESNLQLEQATLYAQDLSIAYRREKEQRETLDKLRFSFLNVVGHELKTPLVVILQGLETLQQNIVPQDTEHMAIINTLKQQSSYLHTMIESLVTFATFSAKQGEMDLSPTEVKPILDEVLALSRFKAAPKNIIVVDYHVHELPCLPLDKEKISEAIDCLIDNAIKFSPEGSQITLQTAIDDQMLVLNVIDQGCGIPADQIDQIWDSFTQMNTSMERGLEGLGLGLAMARYTVEAHHGEISVESEVGVGSTFSMRLPGVGIY